jgi:hypothetical protein
MRTLTTVGPVAGFLDFAPIKVKAMNAEILVGATAIAITVVLTVIIVALARLARSNKSSMIRVFSATTAAVLLLLSPGVFDTMVTVLNSTSGMRHISIDPGWQIKVVPAIIAVVTAFLVTIRDHAKTASRLHENDHRHQQ